MLTDRNLLLQRSIDSMTVPGILVAHRLIEAGDEFALSPEEIGERANSVVKVRRASGAARIVARELLLRLGQAQRTIPRSRTGIPVWPRGIVGSLAHEPTIAIAAVAQECDFSSVGIDIEPAERLDRDLLDWVATPRERQTIDRDPCGGRVLFSIKEAVYKAVYPLDGTFLDHQDVEVCFATGTALVCSGRIVNIQYCVATHIVALAFVSAPRRSL